jgi:hypothetical protein
MKLTFCISGGVHQFVDVRHLRGPPLLLCVPLRPLCGRPALARLLEGPLHRLPRCSRRPRPPSGASPQMGSFSHSPELPGLLRPASASMGRRARTCLRSSATADVANPNFLQEAVWKPRQPFTEPPRRCRSFSAVPLLVGHQGKSGLPPLSLTNPPGQPLSALAALCTAARRRRSCGSPRTGGQRSARRMRVHSDAQGRRRRTARVVSHLRRGSAPGRRKLAREAMAMRKSASGRQSNISLSTSAATACTTAACARAQ